MDERHFSFDFTSLGQRQQVNEREALLVKKFLFVNLYLFVYTLHLCLTTICTPHMYVNWFLVINDCRFTYSNVQ